MLLLVIPAQAGIQHLQGSRFSTAIQVAMGPGLRRGDDKGHCQAFAGSMQGPAGTSAESTAARPSISRCVRCPGTPCFRNTHRSSLSPAACGRRAAGSARNTHPACACRGRNRSCDRPAMGSPAGCIRRTHPAWRLDRDHGDVIPASSAMSRPAYPSIEQIEALREAGAWRRPHAFRYTTAGSMWRFRRGDW